MVRVRVRVRVTVTVRVSVRVMRGWHLLGLGFVKVRVS